MSARETMGQVLELVAPGLVRRYWQARILAERFRRVYDAAKPGTQRLIPRDTRSGDAVVNQAGTSIRRWARHLDENSDVAIGVLDCLVNRIVGTGLTYEPAIRTVSGEPDVLANRSARLAFKRWSSRPETTGELPRSEVERQVARTWLRDGEVFFQHFLGRGSGYQFEDRIPYVIELIEPDLVPLDKNENNPRIIQGIERDDFGRPIAYHFLRNHPGDTLLGAGGAVRDTLRIDAELVGHLKFTRRIKQGRGVSIFHGVITRLDDLKDYEESERIAARVAAAFTAAIKRTGDFSGNIVNAEDPTKRHFEMAPGMIFDNLLPGEEVQTISSNRPNPNLAEFIKDQLKRVAAGTGATYSTISRDYSGSYSSQRQELIEGEVGYDRLRSYFCERFAKTIYSQFMLAALASGEIETSRATDIESIDDVVIRAAGMPWIDPQREANADKTALETRLKSRSQIIRERGGDPDAVREQIAADRAADAALGIADTRPALPAPGAQGELELEDADDQDAELEDGAEDQDGENQARAGNGAA